MISLRIYADGENFRVLDKRTERWNKVFQKRGPAYTRGFINGYSKAGSPFSRWIRTILPEMDARLLGAKKALKTFNSVK
jgi:hypothetical protein